MRLGYLDCAPDPYTTPPVKNFRGFRGLGAFGKGFMVPPPAAPGATTQTVTTAYSKKTGNYYAQDPACAEGEKMQGTPCEKISEKKDGCTVTGCCELVMGPPFCVADCDLPGTMINECDDDPDYAELPDEEWESCDEAKAAYSAAGAPLALAEKLCKALNLPSAETMKANASQARAQQQQAMAHQQQAMMAQQAAANQAAAAAMTASQRESARQSARNRTIELRQIRAQRAAQRKALAGLGSWSQGKVKTALVAAGLLAVLVAIAK